MVFYGGHLGDNNSNFQAGKQHWVVEKFFSATMQVLLEALLEADAT